MTTIHLIRFLKVFIIEKNPKNTRTRCCAHIQKGDLSILIDTSPDIKHQFLSNNIKSLDAIIYTHEHADQTTGIFEMRPFYWKNNKKIPVYGSARTIKSLKRTYTFCFSEKHGYKPIMKANIIKNSFKIMKKILIIPIIMFRFLSNTNASYEKLAHEFSFNSICLLYPSPSPLAGLLSRKPSSA